MSSTQAHDCWSLLVVKARQGLQSAQQQLAQAQARLVQLRAGETRLRGLMAEYRERQSLSLSQGRLMADSLNDQRFIAQLQRLLDQATRSADATAQQCVFMTEQLTRARRELDKAEKLEAHARAQENLAFQRAQQKAQDEWSTMRYGRIDA